MEELLGAVLVAVVTTVAGKVVEEINDMFDD